MVKEEELEKEITKLEEKLKDREDALPAHSVKPHQILLLEELETNIEKKKSELTELRKKNPDTETGRELIHNNRTH